MALDKKNRQLLAELDQNARASYAQLARRLHLSDETVRYRVERLVETGVIRGFQPIINYRILGMRHYPILLRFQAALESDIEELISFCNAVPQVFRVIRLQGEMHLMISIIVRTVEELSVTVDRIMDRFSRIISYRDMSANVYGVYFGRTYLFNRKRKKVGRPFDLIGDLVELDETNTRILQLLTSNARATGPELLRSLRENSGKDRTLSRESVLKRIKRLEAEGVIAGYKVVVDTEKIGVMTFKVLMYLGEVDAEKRKRFVQACIQDSRVVFLVKVAGSWDYELNIEAEAPGGCNELLVDLRKNHPGVLRDYSILMVTEMAKVDHASFVCEHERPPINIKNIW